MRPVEVEYDAEIPVVEAIRQGDPQAMAELMVSRHVHGVPVVQKNGELVGFVSTMDVLAWLSGLR